MSRTIAIVEDDADQRENYSDALLSQGYKVQTYGNKSEALEGFTKSLPDLAILDIMLENEIDGGIRYLSGVKTQKPQNADYISHRKRQRYRQSVGIAA